MAKKWRLIAEIVLQMDVNWIEHNKKPLLFAEVVKFGVSVH